MALTVGLAGIASAFNQYQIVDLGTMPSGGPLRPTGVNSLGHVVGYGTNSAGYNRSFFWNNGAIQSLGPDSSGDVGGSQVALRSYAMDLNDSDQVVGYRDHFSSFYGVSLNRAFRWNVGSGGTVDNIPNFGNSFLFSNVARSINNAGTVTGDSTGKNGASTSQPYRYTTNSGTVWMGSLTGDTSSDCYGMCINSQANICGYGESPTEYHSYRSNGASLINMGAFPNPLIFEPPLQSYGMAINDANSVAGYYQVDASTFRAFYKSSAGTYQDLGLLPGSNVSDDTAQAMSMNNAEVIVGNVEVGNANNRAAMYEMGLPGASWIDLNTKLPANSGWVLTSAADISENGYIVGFGKKNGVDRGYLLKPTVIVSGSLVLEDWDNMVQGATIQFEVRDAGTGQLLETLPTQLGPNGTYTFTTTAVGANKYIRAKRNHWLAQSTAAVDLTSNITRNFSLKNGDVDTDNEVGIGDYSLLSSAFNSFGGDPNYYQNADLNGDLAVDIGDYSILSTNYGLLGDD